ncbi:MAG: hypothetical protein PHE51_09600 [Eubacteriales bacterium]|nr:hypothetical protein [Eubacteriales bacterium]
MYKGLKHFFCEPNKIILYINIAVILIYFVCLFFGYAIWSKSAGELVFRVAKYIIAIVVLNVGVLLLCIFMKNNTFSLIANWGALLLFGVVLVMIYQAKLFSVSFLECIYYVLLLAVSVGNTIK